ncbi:MAG: signal recognition particle protein [Desulfurococcales archaeon]|nr:signal recognition particle protein [Desulfurococcales archaeon]
MKGFEKLREKVAKFLRGIGPSEKAVDEFIKELQKTLIKADVNVKVVFELTKKIKERALSEEPPPGILKREWFVKAVYDSLVELFGGEEKPQVIPTKQPWTIMLVGIQGSGKTTASGKLALFYKKLGFKPALLTTDTYRPAAYEQLKQIATSINVPFYGKKEEKDPVKIAVDGLRKLIEDERANIVIIDTAGRHGYGEEKALLDEMESMAKVIRPSEVILVIDAYMGQKAYDLARRFHERTPIGSIILTKLDGTAKGGGALSAVAATGARIKFISDGEKLEDFEVFNARKYVARLLGLGDLETLLEKFKALEESKALEKRLEKALTTGKLTLRDVYAQIQSIKKLGPLRKVLQLIPGVSMLPIDDERLRISEKKMTKWLSIMNSMTYEELDNPSLIDKKRIRRIALGSGATPEEVKELLQYYETIRKLIKDVKRRKGLLKRLGMLSELHPK